MKPWSGVIPAEDEATYELAGFGGSAPIGKRPALLIIDVQYRTMGTRPMPLREAMQEFQTSCGEAGWAASANIERLLKLFRERDWPVIYPYVAPKVQQDFGRLAEKSPGIMAVPPKGYEFVEHVKPTDRDLLLPKRHPSAFFGTPLVSYLVDMGVDTLITTGCTTSGCVRGTVVDGFSYNFRIGIPHDAVYDRSQTAHDVNLFDMAAKYAEVDSTDAFLARLEAL
ncbi:MAG: isochorismatase family protein [Pigmentiphaga sp.]